MFLGGALSILAVLPAPDPDHSDHRALAVIAGVLALSAVVLTLARRRMWALIATDVWGVLIVSALVAVGRPLAMIPIFYLWPVLHSAYFFSRRHFIVTLTTVGVTFPAALALFSPPDLRLVYFICTAAAIAVVGVVIDVLKRRIDRLVGALSDAASTDPLTGMLNRRAFESAFDRELERARRLDLDLTLVVFDLDHFKALNDRFGHAYGDEALVSFSELLRSLQRGGDLAARVGGEEFAVLLLGADGEDGRAFAERLRAELAIATATAAARLSTSAGVAELGPELQTRGALMRAADAALYAAKNAGRARVEVALAVSLAATP